ncbi:hypothetical protein [Nocardioides ungokensis]
MTKEVNGPKGVDAAFASQFMSAFQTNGLQVHLLEASTVALSEALANVDEPVVSARNAGLALELLAKAVIFGRERGALSGAPKKYREAAVAFLEGRGHPDVWSLADVTTVNGTTAVETAYDLIGAEPPEKARVDAVFRPRNRAVHMAQADQAASLGALAETMRLGVPLLEDLRLSIIEWLQEDSGMGEIATAILKSNGSARAPIAFAKKWRASNEWLSMSERLPADVLRDLAADPRVKPDADDPFLSQCPTGGHFAWFELDAELSDVQEDESSVEYDLYLGYLHCPLCGLEVEYAELEELGHGAPVGRRYRERDGDVTVDSF